jgi:hypothetical protein
MEPRAMRRRPGVASALRIALRRSIVTCRHERGKRVLSPLAPRTTDRPRQVDSMRSVGHTLESLDAADGAPAPASRRKGYRPPRATERSG